MHKPYGVSYRCLTHHPAVALNNLEFIKYMNDTKDILSVNDC